jgi:hypothetical protein
LSYDANSLGRDVFVLATIVVSFAVWVTAHCALAAGLALRTPRARGLLAFLVPPLAPYFGLREKMAARGITWIIAAVVYVGARVAAAVLAP